MIEDILPELVSIMGESGLHTGIVSIRIGETLTNNIAVRNFADEIEDINQNKDLKEDDGNASLFIDVIDVVENDRKPSVDASVGRNAQVLILSKYKEQKIGQVAKLPLSKFINTDMKGEV